MKATKLPSGRWRAQVYLGKDKDGKNIMQSITADTKNEAELQARLLKQQHKDYISDDCTVADALDRYITKRKSVLSPSTYREYRNAQRRDYDPVNRLRLSAVNSETIQAFINDYSIDHSPKSVRNCYGLLKSAIHSIVPDKPLRVDLPQKKPKSYSLPTDDDIKMLLKNADPQLRIAILLASVGTMRRGEIAALKYCDIDGNFVHVRRVLVKNVNNEWVVKSIPKTTTSDRWIEYPAKVIAELGCGDKDDFILSIDPDRITNRFCKLRNRLGIDARFHDLRHYAASIMHALGVPDQYIMERGGWSSDAVLKGVYRNVLKDKRNQFIDLTNQYMNDII